MLKQCLMVIFLVFIEYAWKMFILDIKFDANELVGCEFNLTLPSMSATLGKIKPNTVNENEN